MPNKGKGKSEYTLERVGRGLVGPDSEPPSEIRKRLEHRMKELGLQKKVVAKNIGISRTTLNAILNTKGDKDEHLPRIEHLLGLALELQMHPFWLVEALFDQVKMKANLATKVYGDRGGHVADVTSPDGMIVSPGSVFTKTWRVQNLGDVVWRKRKLKCWDDDLSVEVRSKSTGELIRVADRLIPHVREVEIPELAPGDVHDVSVQFTAPETTGAVLSHWLLVNEDGSLSFGDNALYAGLWALVQVTTLADTIAFFPKRQEVPRDPTSSEVD